MKLKIQFALSLLLFSGATLFAQIPDGGIRLNAETGTTWQKIGSCDASEVDVTGQAFDKAIHVEVQSDINNSWNAQVKFPSIDGIETGDVVLVAFYARTIFAPGETGQGTINVIIENNSTYAKDLSYSLTIGNEWKQYFASAECVSTLSTSEVSYLFHCGFPDQIIEVADVQYLNYKQTLTVDELPFTEITYWGQEPDAAWRAPAAERIDQHRKGPMDITVYDADGVPLEGAAVTIEMVQHQFGFGTAIGASTFNTDEGYRDTTLAMFNEVVFENDLKWKQFNISITGHITKAMDTLDKYHVPVRGHNIIWPSWRFLPGFMEDIQDDPVALRNAIDDRFRDVVTYTSGRLNDWDVINEAYSEHDIQDILGDEVMAEWFKKVKLYDRDVKLYLNEYGIVNGGGKNEEKKDFYYNLVEQIEAWGGEIDGIGIQGHMGSELTSIPKVYDVIDRFAALGKEIKITEFDIDITQRPVQADYTRDFLTIMFSHPSVKSVLVWGFWAGKHWKPEAAFYNEDWSIRPHGQMWKDMIYKEWWTRDTTITSGSQGKISHEGYLGRYRYTIDYNGNSYNGEFTISNSNHSGPGNKIIISLDDSFPETAEIKSSIEGYLCEGETANLAVPIAEGVSYTWFKDGIELTGESAVLSTSEAGIYSAMLSKGDMQLLTPGYEVVVHEAPVATMFPTGDTTLCGGGTVLLSGNTDTELKYSWLNNGSQILTNTNEIEVNQSGKYQLVTMLNGCTAKSDSLVVTTAQNPESTIFLSGDNPMCEGESVYLLGSTNSGLSFTWFRDETMLDKTGRVVEVNEGGVYTVATSNGNCSLLSDPVEVVVYPYPDASITVEGDLTFCDGEQVTLAGNEAEGLLYTWRKDGSLLEPTDRIIQVSESGKYTLTTTYEICSETSDEVVVEVLPASDPTCANGVIENELRPKVYPNPAQGYVYIESLGIKTLSGKIELINARGQLVYEEEAGKLANKLKIDLPDTGLYLLRIVSNGRTETYKLINR